MPKAHQCESREAFSVTSGRKNQCQISQLAGLLRVPIVWFMEFLHQLSEVHGKQLHHKLRHTVCSLRPASG